MKIFLSSTYEDLIDYRSSVMDVLQGFEIVYKGMEHFGASEHSPIEVCLSNLADSDRVIVLVGTRYGSRPDDNSPSYTELEIREAERIGKPLQIYVLDTDRQPVLYRFIDGGQNAEDLDLK